MHFALVKSTISFNVYNLIDLNYMACVFFNKLHGATTGPLLIPYRLRLVAMRRKNIHSVMNLWIGSKFLTMSQ
jgi:hypothetical protein